MMSAALSPFILVPTSLLSVYTLSFMGSVVSCIWVLLVLQEKVSPSRALDSFHPSVLTVTYLTYFSGRHGECAWCGALEPDISRACYKISR